MGNETTKNLLIVEDDRILSDRLARSMERRGYATRQASGKADAIAQIEVSPPDFAIIDLRLGDGSGLDVIEFLSSANPAARSIIYTGYGNIPTAVSAIRLGAFSYVTKPADADEIDEILLRGTDDERPLPQKMMSPKEARLAQIRATLEACKGNISRADEKLGMHRRTLQRTITKHGLRDPA